MTIESSLYSVVYDDMYTTVRVTWVAQSNAPSFDERSKITRSKSLALPRLWAMMISFLRSKTEIPVPSNVTLDSSLCDLNL